MNIAIKYTSKIILTSLCFLAVSLVIPDSAKADEDKGECYNLNFTKQVKVKGKWITRRYIGTSCTHGGLAKAQWKLEVTVDGTETKYGLAGCGNVTNYKACRVGNFCKTDRNGVSKVVRYNNACVLKKVADCPCGCSDGSCTACEIDGDPTTPPQTDPSGPSGPSAGPSGGSCVDGSSCSGSGNSCDLGYKECNPNGTFVCRPASEALCPAAGITSDTAPVTLPGGAVVGDVKIKDFYVGPPNSIDPISSGLDGAGVCEFKWTFESYDQFTECSLLNEVGASVYTFNPFDPANPDQDPPLSKDVSGIDKEVVYKLSCKQVDPTTAETLKTDERSTTCFINHEYKEAR